MTSVFLGIESFVFSSCYVANLKPHIVNLKMNDILINDSILSLGETFLQNVLWKPMVKKIQQLFCLINKVLNCYIHTPYFKNLFLKVIP